VTHFKTPLATARAHLRIAAVHLFVKSVVKNENAIFSKTKQFRAVVSIYDLWEVLHDLVEEPIIGPLKLKMAEIRHLENREIAISRRKVTPF